MAVAIGAALTEREREVVTLVALGMTNKEIAQQLSLAVGTVKTHMARIGYKIGDGTRSAIVAHCLREGIIS